jgi:hypothetical protein
MESHYQRGPTQAKPDPTTVELLVALEVEELKEAMAVASARPRLAKGVERGQQLLAYADEKSTDLARRLKLVDAMARLAGRLRARS